MGNFRLERTGGNNLPAVQNTYTVGGFIPEMEPDEPTVPASHYLWILRRHRWKILAFVTICTVASYIVTKRLTPIYESTATVDIDRQIPSSALGSQSEQTPSFMDADAFISTQMKLVESDSVLRPVVQRLRLAEREATSKDEAKNPAARNPRAADAPVVLPRLRVVRPRETYLMYITYRSADPQIAAEVANGVAESFLEHSFKIRFDSSASLTTFMEKRLEELRAKMERSSESLLKFQREFGVVNPDEKSNVYSQRLMQLNTEYTNAQSERVKKEAAFNSMESGSLEAALISTQGEALKRLTEEYNDALQHFEEVKLHLAENHPEFKKAAGRVAELQRQLQSTKGSIGQRVEIEYRQAAQREEMLRKTVAQVKGELDGLNSRSFDYESLKREADADQKLYSELVRKVKEAGINANFQGNSVRIADRARPAMWPVFPSVRNNVLIAFLLSMIFACGAALISDGLDKTIRDPEQVTRSLKTDVIGTLPAIKSWRGKITRTISPGPSDAGSELVPLGNLGEKNSSGYDEAIRTLRNSILLTDFDRRLKSILVTSASPSEGKSTVAAHLAAAHAEQKHRTLIIDGDLRRPSVHKFFELPDKKGLSNVLVHGMAWREAAQRPDGLEDIDVIQAGAPSRRAADLIGKMLPQILEEASLEYDLIVLDAPPLLGFPEPLQMAAAVDGVVVVARAGHTNKKAVSNVVATLGRLRANIIGVVLNEVRKEMSESYYYYGYYDKYYRPNSKKSA